MGAELCEFKSLEEFPAAYSRLAVLLRRAEQTPSADEIEFLHGLHHRDIHYSGAIGSNDYFFLIAFASILAPKHAVEIGTSTGFSSALIAFALHRRHQELDGPLVDTIDLHSEYIVDRKKPIGFEIAQVLPERPGLVRVHTARQSDFVRDLARPNELAFVFIDADHQHPWPLLDLLRVAPYVGGGGWILLHDIRLGTMGVTAKAHDYPLSYGAPFGAEWLFDRWPFRKINGGNMGALQLPSDKISLLPMAFQLMELPFEVNPASCRRMRHELYRAIITLIRSTR
ncbi:MAG TPA: class I SAM-dependent methyltransferase [Chthoniobacterales bacterium]|nr:class I SAM-dependent methyltransferase [Chthoniobacterales bacterium]